MIAPCYLIHGGEPLQTEEIISSITLEARKSGYNKYVVFELNASSNWEELLNKCQNLDLFADRTLLELRLSSDTVNKQTSQILEQILLNQDINFCIIIRAPKLKAQTLNSPWATHIHKKGKVHVAKPIASNMWSLWLTKRLASAGFSANNEALELIAKCYEGNLLAAAQFINKIAAVLSPGKLDVDQIRPFIDTNNQFTLFELTNAAIKGNVPRTIEIFNSLKAEGIEPILVLWALTRESRNLPTHRATQLLHMAKNIDFTIKGIQPGDAWDLLLDMCLVLTGIRTLTMGGAV